MTQQSAMAYGRQGVPASVQASVTLGLEEFIEQQGGHSQSIFRRCGMQSGLYQQPDRHIPLKHYIDTMHEAARDTGNEHFGLWFGEQFRPQGLGLYGYAALTSPDLGTALMHMQTYFHQFQRNSLLALHRHQGLCQLEYRLLDGEIMDRRQDAELTLGMLNNVLRHAMGPHWAPDEVQFQHPALVSAAPHQRAFHCDVRFSCSRNIIIFRESCLDQPMDSADPLLNQVILGTLQQLAGKPQTQQPFSQRVRCEIRDDLAGACVSAAATAARLNMTTRTLQRRLAAEQLTFRQLTEQVRQEMALYYLSYRSLTVSETAFRLGYSEVSAFTRAFSRWQGLSPSEWRLQNQ